ncbi:outer membrane protein assembly factor BamB family protein [Sphingobacterium psychroaquaticum]|uniref:PQQ-like domain-containing protein n=1 Tax=Sphingobacterium psychroaquaticum TaxID=561061 RepID=A0A1X7L173_9SPHI|nr:PQQ-binding-like beta-propeller repeat protein [Sphingobacterium psychroaquaticum]QBQ39740.1 metallophosphoesterase [Sphingobacterium psychroaquaticum]SMG46869.1 PQQ-like domain-containing protein [Sphingobacterium psychroaquaticum]
MFLRYSFLFLLFTAFSLSLSAQQTFKFAQVTDTHVGGATGADDLRRTVKDLNTQKDIDFVILSGDVTEFGSDLELALAKQILDSLKLPLYVIPGNHDSNWSESGANSFRKVFGSEMFFFKHKGYQFMGTTSGPNMRMSPGQIPRENLVWMDSVFQANPDKETPLIYINHYPQDSSLNNWYEAIDRLKGRNVQLALCGHGHANKLYNWEGIPGVMGRSNLRAKDSIGGYNIITIGNGMAHYEVRRPLAITEASWLEVPLINHRFDLQKVSYKRPDFSVNQRYNNKVQVAWTFQDNSDLGAGFAKYGNLLITGNTTGAVYALDVQTGKKIWTYKTGGKVYATPAVWKTTVVVGSSDGNIYGLDAKTGKLNWKLQTAKAVLGSTTIDSDGIAFIGASDGQFRAIDVKTGKLRWSFDKLKGFVSTKPTLYKEKVIFGDWGNGFYALDRKSGQLLWEWNNGHANRMFSAAACYPVVSNNRVFLVAPDRFMTCLDVETGEVIWREKKDPIRVRESMGLSKDGQYVYVKTMDGNLLGVSTKADSMEVAWKSALQLPYELTPSAIETNGKQVFVPSHSGLVSGINAKSGAVSWQYKLSNAMINPIFVLDANHVVVSTMDGVIAKIHLLSNE